MADDAIIRAIGADHRNTLAAQYHARGPQHGYKLARRYIEETVAEVTEVHGRRQAFTLLCGVEDRLVAGRDLDADDGRQLPGVVDLPEDEPTPGMKAALARHMADAKSITFDIDTETCTVKGIKPEAAVRLLREAVKDCERVERESWNPIARWLYETLWPAAWVRWTLLGLAIGLAIK